MYKEICPSPAPLKLKSIYINTFSKHIVKSWKLKKKNIFWFLKGLNFHFFPRFQHNVDWRLNYNIRSFFFFLQYISLGQKTVSSFVNPRNADAALARPWALTITPTCWSVVCHPSQEHQAGDLPAPFIRPWVDETKSAWQEIVVGGWGEGGSLSKDYKTVWSLMQMRWRGQKDQTTHRKRWTQKGVGEESGLLKQWFPQQKWVSIRRSVLTMLVCNKLGQCCLCFPPPPPPPPANPPPPPPPFFCSLVHKK